MHGSDTTHDGKASAFATFEGICLSVSPAVLESRITALQAKHCVVPTAGIVAKPAAAPALPAGCKDMDVAMSALMSQTCKQVKAKQMCKAVTAMGAQKICGCSCPLGKPSSRRQVFAFANSACSMSTFEKRLANVSKACCGAARC